MKYRVITGVLEARTAVHVGSGEGNELADSLLRRDTQGNLIIPGTAVAGVLRGLLTRLAPRLAGKDGVCQALEGNRQSCACRVCRLFGDVNPSDAPGSESAASRLLVFNAVLQDATNAPLIRDGVGIDRASGAAARAAAAKFAVETLPAGATFALRLELRETDPEDEALLAAALAEWMQGRAHLGGDVARGMGAFCLNDVRCRERDLDEPAELMAFLHAPRPWEQAAECDGWLQERLDTATQHIVDWDALPEDIRQLPVARGWAEWEFTLQAEGPLLTHDATAAGLSGFDHAPLLAAMADWTHPVLAGSGLRGVLRAHAERIARTLTTHQAVQQHQERAERRHHFLARCPACDPLARRSEPGNGVALECCDSLLRHEIRFDENREVQMAQLCLACQLFGSTRNGSRLIVEDAPYFHPEDNPPTYKMLDFLAIDRFTGGGAEHLKFDALALWRPAFKVRIFLDNPQEWELGWLMLALRDLAEGWLHVGFGAAKGFGQVKIADGVLRRATLDVGRVKSGQPSVYTVDEQPILDWTQATEWVNQFGAAVETFERGEGLDLPADTYFGIVDGIYGERRAQ
jgi:CRISPR/Cas system CSM-associated protein Csm3 (group 7 of RAMP superfamily)